MPEKRPATLVSRSLSIAAGCAFIALTVYNASLARADWFRRHPTPERIQAAIEADPLNPYAYTLRAELLEQAGRDARVAWRDALQRDPRNAESLIRLGLADERTGDITAAEGYLLKAAQYSQTWLPRWSLADFYLRHNNPVQALHWAALTAARASGDLTSLFESIDKAGATPEAVVDNILPVNRMVLSSYTAFRLSRPQPGSTALAATRLAALIPDQPPDPPGYTRIRTPFIRQSSSYPASNAEKRNLFATVDKLLNDNQPAAAIGLWNLLSDRTVVTTGHWVDRQLIVNGDFRTQPSGGAFDWRIVENDGAIVSLWPDLNAAVVSLSGRQAESVDLLSQRLYVPPGAAYLFHFETTTGQPAPDTGIRWELRGLGDDELALPVSGSSDWTAQTSLIRSQPAGRIVRLVLSYRRSPGTVRYQEELRIRSVRMDKQ